MVIVLIWFPGLVPYGLHLLGGGGHILLPQGGVEPAERAVPRVLFRPRDQHLVIILTATPNGAVLLLHPRDQLLVQPQRPTQVLPRRRGQVLGQVPQEHRVKQTTVLPGI
jgi:hypothetical protein